MNFTKIAAALLILPVLFCSCSTSDHAKTQEPSGIHEPETPVQEEPQAVEVKADPKTEADLAAQEEKKTEKAVPAVTEEKSMAKPEAKPEKKPALPCKHTVCTGDNLWKISRHYYGTGSQWKQIYDANREKIKNADFLEPGTVLNIPAAK